MSGWSSSSLSSSRSMASSRSLSSRAGSYTIGRGIITLALDALKFALDGAEIKQEGDHFVHLQSELGDKRYRKFCEDGDLALTEIHYCQEGLDIARINARGQETVLLAQVEEMKQMKDLINHDYLVLKIQPGEPDVEAFHIMAHKLRGGIHVTHIPSSELTTIFHEGVRCFTIDCDRGEKKRIRLWTLVAILKVEDPDYSLRNANCWDYAKNTAKRLVKACVEVSGISAAEKARLQQQYDNLEANLAFRHMHNIAKSLLRRVSSGLAPKAPRVSNPSKALDTLSSAAELSSPLKAPAAISLARVSSSSRAQDMVEHSAPPGAPTASQLARVSSSSRFLDSSLPLDQLSSSPSPNPTALDLSNSSEHVNSSRVVELSSPPTVDSTAFSRESSTAPQAVSSGKICLQVVFLMFLLLINNLGLGPWASGLLGRANSG